MLDAKQYKGQYSDYLRDVARQVISAMEPNSPGGGVSSMTDRLKTMAASMPSGVRVNREQSFFESAPTRPSRGPPAQVGGVGGVLGGVTL